MAETSKVNHDHTYDILTSLMNVCPSSPEEKELLLEITSPQPSDTSSDSGLSLSPMEFDSLDIDLGDKTPLDNFDLDTTDLGCPSTCTDELLDNIGDFSDIDLSFLDGLDSKTLGMLPELYDATTTPNKTESLDLESLIEMADDGIVADTCVGPAPVVSDVLPAKTKPVASIQVLKTTAKVTPIVITEIRSVTNVPAKAVIREKEDKLVISEEERKLLEEEGHVLPTNVALTKEEEKVLKRVRRKIKNKVSAQESRRKKKEYIDGLEFRVKTCTDENRVLQQKVTKLEEQNKSLLEQLKTLQELVSNSNRSKKQTSTCILVLFLAFALVAFPFNKISSHSPKDSAVADSYATLPVRSRTLLQFNEETEPPSTLNISHYLRAFSIVFSFTKDKPEVDSFTTPSSVAFNDVRNTNDDGLKTEYSFSK